MRATLIGEQNSSTRRRFRQRRAITGGSDDWTPKVTDDEEMSMVAKYVIAVAILGVTPLAMFLFIHYFMPDLLLFLDPPTK